jgi:hypothetical protein
MELSGSVAKSGQLIRSARSALQPRLVTDAARKYLEDVEQGHADMEKKLDELYSLLEIHIQIPTTLGISFEFMKTLMAAHTLKLGIRKKAINTFLEMERLDQAVKGKHQPLGM